MQPRCLTAGSGMQAGSLSSAAHLRGTALNVRAPRVVRASVQTQVLAQQFEERFRLDNLAPEPGARRKKQRVGRGYGAGQGGTCGDGMRGQKARSGGGIRPGFEGGQMPLYRRLPKLRGIAGGMSAGVPKYVVVNLKQLNEKFADGEEVNVQTVQDKGLFKLTGRESRLPLKVLGDGELSVKVKVSAVSFSGSAAEKIQAAGGTVNQLPGKVKWTKALGKERAEAAAKNPVKKQSRKQKKAAKSE